MTSKIHDIANEAQVSTATVSRVLNGTKPVSDALSARVMAVVERLHFEPNLAAQSLRTRRSLVIGVIIPNISNPFFTIVAQAVQEVAEQAGYIVTICSSHENLATENKYLQLMHNRRVDGVIIGVVDRNMTQLTALLQSSVPIVLVDRRLEGAAIDSVTVDNQRGAYIAVEHLIQRGYQRIAMLGGSASISTAVDRLAGYRQALHDNDLSVDETLVVAGSYTKESGVELGKRLLSLPDPPTAVLVASNQMALGFFGVVKEYGLHIPHTVAIIGFVDGVWTSLVTPPITVIDVPDYDLGKSAAEMLLKRIRGEETGEPKHVVLRTKLVIRGST